MIIPICCFTCGKQIAHLWEKYIDEVTKVNNKKKDVKINISNDLNVETIEKKTLDKMKIRKYCCRRMFISHVDLCEKI